MNPLLQKLPEKARKGSKARCHLFTHGSPEQVAKWMTGLMEPYGSVAANDQVMPRGFEVLAEAQLHRKGHLPELNLDRAALTKWWLADSNPMAATPNWDLAATCTIDNKPGLLLVEAKAHHAELNQNDKCHAGEKNRERIGAAISEANDGLNQVLPGWNLTHKKHYQLCNRFAWSWKLASLGIPVVLVYLGFLGADEMSKPFNDAKSWDGAVRNYARDFVPDSIWGGELLIDGVPLYPLIRPMTVSLDSCGGPTEIVTKAQAL